jgi:hypothetical protein
MSQPEQITTRDGRVAAIIRDGNRQREEAAQRAAWDELRRQKVGRAPYEAPARDKAFAGKMFTDIFPDGAWRGHRAWIIAGGPSLRGFDFSQLKGELVIAVNRAFENVDAQIMFSMDSRFYDWVITGALGQETRDRFSEFAGAKVWLDTFGHPYEGVFTIHSAGLHGLTASLKDGLCHGNNSGYAALNLAVCLGTSPVYLLGFDMGYAGAGATHYHDGYPQTQPDSIVKTYALEFEAQAAQISAAGCRVINCNLNSGLRCFEFLSDPAEGTGTWPIARIQRPIIVSYYTPGLYEDEAKKLVRSCRRFNMERDVQIVEDLGSWQANTHRKAAFILAMLDKHPGRGVLFVDADAELQAQPWELENIREDVGLCWRDYSVFPSGARSAGRELLSGTAYFSQSGESHDLLKMWIRENEANPAEWEQRNLERVVTRGGWDGTIKEFPPQYCQIFDSMKSAGQPVIEHYQASRRSKG